MHCMVIAFSIYHFTTVATKQALTNNRCNLVFAVKTNKKNVDKQGYQYFWMIVCFCIL